MPDADDDPTGNAEESGVTESGAEESAAEGLRRRYREALERKIDKSGGGGRDGAHGPGSESMSATASAKTKRTFRRKSGG